MRPDDLWLRLALHNALQHRQLTLAGLRLRLVLDNPGRHLCRQTQGGQNIDTESGQRTGQYGPAPLQADTGGQSTGTESKVMY